VKSEARKILGKVAEKMTDSQIEELINIFIAFSDLAIDSYLQRLKLNEQKYENGISKS
jgi:ABC-type transporter MlaC component